MKKYSLAVTIFILTIIIGTTLKGQTATEELDQELTKTFQSTNIPGMAVAIVNKDKILYQNEFGYADLSTYAPYTQHTIHNIGSLSKTFIGIAIMQLVEQGKLTLDTKINDILPFKVVNPHHESLDITVRHLVTHTSTIRDRIFNYGLRAYVSDDNTKGNRKGLPLKYKIQFKRMLKSEQVTLGQFLENTLSKKGKWYRKKNFYKYAPSTEENYSNIAAALAGYIVEVITGEKYADYVVNHILQPLGMTASGWTYESIDQSQFANRYMKGNPVPNYRLITYPDGGLISSVADLSTYQMAMIKGYYGECNLLSATSFQTLMTDQFSQPPLAQSIKTYERRYGVFWNIFGTKGPGDIGHGGSDPGVLSFMFFDPASGLGCLLLTNTEADTHHEEVVKMWELLIKHREGFRE